MIIRTEQPADAAAIGDLTYAAFLNHPVHAPGALPDEHILVDALRAANALSLSLVATIDEQIVGHIAFSPVTINNADLGWYGIGPLSVIPAKQKQGIGSALMLQGLELIRERGASGCVLVGYAAYYNRFGFQGSTTLTLKNVGPKFLLAMAFVGEIPTASVVFHAAFDA